MQKPPIYDSVSARESQEQVRLRQLRYLARLLYPLLILPVLYAVFTVLRDSPAAIFASRAFAGFFWFGSCIFAMSASHKRRRTIRDTGLRAFYVLAVGAVALMLALNMTGIL